MLFKKFVSIAALSMACAGFALSTQAVAGPVADDCQQKMEQSYKDKVDFLKREFSDGGDPFVKMLADGAPSYSGGGGPGGVDFSCVDNILGSLDGQLKIPSLDDLIGGLKKMVQNEIDTACRQAGDAVSKTINGTLGTINVDSGIPGVGFKAGVSRSGAGSNVSLNGTKVGSTSPVSYGLKSGSSATPSYAPTAPKGGVVSETAGKVKCWFSGGC